MLICLTKKDTIEYIKESIDLTKEEKNAEIKLFLKELKQIEDDLLSFN